MPSFPKSFPVDCPVNADEIDGAIYHGCDNLTPAGDDFVPFACSDDADRQERGKRAGCKGYGISCWKSEESAKHAQEMFEFHAKRHIFKAEVTSNCGQLKDTPSGRDSDHCTFWAYDGVSLRDSATLAWKAPGGQV